MDASQAVRLPSPFVSLAIGCACAAWAVAFSAGADRHDLDSWFAEMDRFAEIPFMENGRLQPPMPEPKDLFE